MSVTLGTWDKGLSAEALGEVADLWNANAAGRHAYHPWSGGLLARLHGRDGAVSDRLLTARDETGALAGVAHASLISEHGYPNAGAVEMLLVDRRFRNRGVGTALLQSAVHFLAAHPAKPGFIDALGAWPFGFRYNTLADGSERSGVFLKEGDLYRLFERAGFKPVRKSLVMRADLAGASPRPAPAGGDFYIAPRHDNTWLDRVFRGRELWDHVLHESGVRLLSRAIFGLMEGESRQEGKAVFSLFGVSTPREHQQKGYAGVNIAHLMRHLRGLGGETLELHVYADNDPALALYRGLGFVEHEETMMMHLVL